MANRVKIKGVVKTAPSASNGRQVVKPKFHSTHGGLLTEKILITVKKEKGKEDKQDKEQDKQSPKKDM